MQKIVDNRLKEAGKAWPKGVLYGIGVGALARTVITLVSALTFPPNNAADKLILVLPNILTLAIAFYSIYALMTHHKRGVFWAKVYLILALIGISPIMGIAMYSKLYVTAIAYLLLFVLHLTILIYLFRNRKG